MYLANLDELAALVAYYKAECSTIVNARPSIAVAHPVFTDWEHRLTAYKLTTANDLRLKNIPVLILYDLLCLEDPTWAKLTSFTKFLDTQSYVLNGPKGYYGPADRVADTGIYIGSPSHLDIVTITPYIRYAISGLWYTIEESGQIRLRRKYTIIQDTLQAV